MSSGSPDIDLAALLGGAAPAEPGRRSRHRVPAQSVIAIEPLSASARAATRVQLTDINATGLGWLASAPSKPGDLYAAWVPLSTTGYRLLLCEVRHCERRRGSFHIGALVRDSRTRGPKSSKIPPEWQHP